MVLELPDGKEAKGKVCGKGLEASMTSGCAVLPTSPRVLQQKALWTLPFWVFVEAALHKQT